MEYITNLDNDKQLRTFKHLYHLFSHGEDNMDNSNLSDNVVFTGSFIVNNDNMPSSPPSAVQDIRKRI